ncbi:MAG: flagellar motor protein MotB [Tranquillimonas sp.]
MSKDRVNHPVIIRRVEEDDHHGHHGGGWKVAYADFMTAMMAFFLLLWILAASDEEKLRGLADYFTPSLSQAGGRGQGLLDGMVLGPEGTMSGTDGPQSEKQLPSFGQENPLAVFDSRLRDEPQTIVEYEMVPDGVQPRDAQADPGTAPENAEAEAERQAELERQAQQREVELASVEDQIGMAIRQSPDLNDFASNVILERTPEGLRVQIVDQEGKSMFASGSAAISGDVHALIDIVGQAIADLPYSVVIAGHTDNVPFLRRSGYGNWELSADRANATRRVLLDAGVSPKRITRISGLADTQPLDPADPAAPQNRRISILVEYPEAQMQIAAPQPVQ